MAHNWPQLNAQLMGLAKWCWYPRVAWLNELIYHTAILGREILPSTLFATVQWQIA